MDAGWLTRIASARSLVRALGPCSFIDMRVVRSVSLKARDRGLRNRRKQRPSVMGRSQERGEIVVLFIDEPFAYRQASMPTAGEL